MSPSHNSPLNVLLHGRQVLIADPAATAQPFDLVVVQTDPCDVHALLALDE
jgi:hypothetical protein